MWSWVSKKYLKTLCTLKVNSQDGIDYLLSYDSFLHAQNDICVEYCSLDSATDRLLHNQYTEQKHEDDDRT